MKNKMKFLVKQSMNKKIKTKWFVVVNILLLVLLVALANMDKIITAFGGDFDKKSKIIVVDNNTGTYDSFKTYYESLNEQTGNILGYTVETSNENITTLTESLSEDENNTNIIIEIEVSEEEYLISNITSFNPIDTISLQIINATLNAIKSEYALTKTNIDTEELARVLSPMTVTQIVTNPEIEENAQAKDILATSVMIIFILPFFILTILLVQMLGAEINDEKTTRSMEIIISNVSPGVHFASKIIASLTFTLIQAGLLLLYGGVGVLIRSLLGGGIGIGESGAVNEAISGVWDMLKNTGILSTLAGSIPLIILLLVLSLLAFALLAGVLASMTTSIEDFQQLQSPLMIICMLSYYLALMSSFFEGATFIKIFSYVPFFSAIIAPVIYLLGQTSLLELSLSVVITGGACFVLFYYGLRVYKVGILNYSSKDLWKKVFKSMKEKV